LKDQPSTEQLFLEEQLLIFKKLKLKTAFEEQKFRFLLNYNLNKLFASCREHYRSSNVFMTGKPQTSETSNML
jgi:hypothetical protein